MKLKAFAACGYLGLVYFAAGRVQGLHPLFFPALGAFAYLMITRQSAWREMLKMTAGTIVCSFIGSILSLLHPSSVFLVIDGLLVFWMIHRFKWNAPPIIAVSLIPFFSRSPDWWTFPVSSGIALIGLTLTLAAASVLAQLPAEKAIPSFARGETESNNLANEEPA